MTALVLVVFMFFGAAAHLEASEGIGQFDLDVIFVIDGSGSMNFADPDGLAKVAANLFIDMNEGTDSRAGYVLYSHVIREQRDLTDLVSFSRDIKNSISGFTYSGWTDIDLGLRTAFEMFEREAAQGTNVRQPAIILLSDGNVHMPGWGVEGETPSDQIALMRQAAHTNLISDLQANNPDIPIFTIGFNFDGTLDMDLMTSIADITGGDVFETSDAADLPSILREIYTQLTGARSTNILVYPVTGLPQSVTIPITDNSIHRAIITIMSSQSISDISLANPAGGAGDYVVNTDPSGIYTVLTVMQPEIGNWTLTFTGTEGDTVSVDLISIYDMSLVFDLPRTSPLEAEFSWRMEDEMGIAITDENLISQLAPIIRITNIETGEVTAAAFSFGQMEMTLPMEAGVFTAYLELDDHGIVRTSNIHQFEVTAAPPPTPLLGMGDVSVTMWTIFSPERSIALNEVINFTQENRPIEVVADFGPWISHLEWEYISAVELINLRATSAGSAEIRVIAMDVHGNEIVFFVVVNIISGWIPIIAGIVLLLLVAALVVILKIINKPRLSDPMSKLYIKMSLPASVHAEYPPEAALALPRVKGKKTLRALIADNIAVSEPYRIAFESIAWFADGTTLSAKTKSQLEIKVPQDPRFTVKIDKNTGRDTVLLDKNSGTEIRIGFNSGGGYGEYDEYIINLGNTDGGNMHNMAAPMDDGWGMQQTPQQTNSSDDFW